MFFCADSSGDAALVSGTSDISNISTISNRSGRSGAAVTYDALALFSAGLDSLLAIKVIEAQKLKVKALHYTSPFFGNPEKTACWHAQYGLDVEAVDIGDAYITMMQKGPVYGYGKHFNPCIDCKILMLSHARGLLEQYGARFLITGEVLGQRPMSQRRDALSSIRNASHTEDVLVRPLCAAHLPVTPVERSGLVDRSRLLSLSGRGRSGQLALARTFGIQDIPAPAGGCLLTEPASAKRYGPLFQSAVQVSAADFHLANTGRQYWYNNCWLSIGRDKASNDALARQARPQDILFTVADFPGPVGLGRPLDSPWPLSVIQDAAALVASFASKAVRAGGPVAVRITNRHTCEQYAVTPCREPTCGFATPTWEQTARIRDSLDVKRHRP